MTVCKHKYATGSRSSSPSPPLSFETKKEMMRDMLHQPEPEREPQPDGGEFGSPLHLDHWRGKAKKNVSSRIAHSGRHTQSQGHYCMIHIFFFCSLTQGHPGPFQRAALVRDDFRCIVSERCAYRSVRRNRELSEEVQHTEPACRRAWLGARAFFLGPT